MNTRSDEKNLGSQSPIRVIGVLGAGTMGHGIAQVAAAADYDVIIRDVDNESLARGRQAIEGNLAKGVSLGKVSEEDRDRTLARIKTTTRLEA
ncbi:MAG: 3-hydroxyacyl-CoA dehydrogenase NAD-binding domain-containing protein, partial [Pseudonocardiaceae bacterium]